MRETAIASFEFVSLSRQARSKKIKFTVSGNLKKVHLNPNVQGLSREVTARRPAVFDRLVRTLSDFMICNRLGKSSATFTSNTLTCSPADRHAANVLPIIQEAQKAGATTLRQIAEALNARVWPRRVADAGTPNPSATSLSARKEENMLPITGSLLVGLAVIAVALEATGPSLVPLGSG
jgi:hypothetical protein